MAPPANGSPETLRCIAPAGARARSRSNGSLWPRSSDRLPDPSAQVRVASPPRQETVSVGSHPRIEKRDAGCPVRPLRRRTGWRQPRNSARAPRGSIQIPRSSITARGGGVTGTRGSTMAALPPDKLAVPRQEISRDRPRPAVPHGPPIDPNHREDLPRRVGEEDLAGPFESPSRKTLLQHIDPSLPRQLDDRLAREAGKPLLGDRGRQQPSARHEEQIARR